MLLQLPSLPTRVKSLLPTTPTGASSGAELVTTDGRLLPLVSAELRGEAQGGIARLVLEQTFANRYAEVLRVTYRMPLPADGAVSGYEFVIGERTVKGAVDRKAQARERFERAIVEGKTAALLEQERGDIFTQQIGNIPPGETIVARITIDQRLVWLPEGEWELRFPTVIGPRYIGSADTPADARATHVKVADQPLPVQIQLAIAVRDARTGKPASPTHALAVTGDTVALAQGARLDRDIVVRWPVAKPTVGLALATARPASGAAASDAYGLVTIVPPAPSARAIAVPRDLIVLLDTSGSMSGGPLDKAKQVVSMVLDSLDEHDRFELIEFSDRPRRYTEEPQLATAKAKAAGIKWVRSREADGGTEIREAVIETLSPLRVGAQRQVIVVTDGMVGGERQILEALHRRMPASCRLHVLGVGSSVNRSLATQLARAGRGVEVIVGIDEDAERGAKRLLDRTRQPILTNVEIAGSAVLRHVPEKVPDVFAGAPLVAAVALRAEGGELVVRGQLATESWEQTIRVPAQAAGEGNQAIVALYGRERVADVESHAMFDAIDGEIEDLGLTFQIATRMTSWVAIDESRRVTGPTRDELVPQELPYGTKASAFGLRATAAPRMKGSMQMQLEAADDFADMSVPPPAAAFAKSLHRASYDADDVGEARFDRASYLDEGDAPAGEFEEEVATGELERAVEQLRAQQPSTGRRAPTLQGIPVVTTEAKDTEHANAPAKEMFKAEMDDKPAPEPAPMVARPPVEARRAAPPKPAAPATTPAPRQAPAGPVEPAKPAAPLRIGSGGPRTEPLAPAEPLAARRASSRLAIAVFVAILLALIAALAWWLA